MITKRFILLIVVGTVIITAGYLVGTMLIPRHVNVGQTIFDVTDKRRLVGHATHVFEGRVIAQVGSKGLLTSIPGDSIPQNQYTVEIIEGIKGDAAGTVIVNQYDNIEGDSPLKLGHKYIFVTRYSSETGWHHITAAGHGNIQIKDEKSRKDLVEEFKKARKEQISSESE